jgi:hypothetical protein
MIIKTPALLRGFYFTFTLSHLKVNIMARRRVLCIKSRTGAPRHEYITHIGGDWGLNTQRLVIPESQAISELTPPVTNSYYVRDIRGDEAEVKVVTHFNGKKYLTTNPDYTTNDNLSKLDECKSV